MLALENRSFEARFGDRCPFCGRTWGDPSPCGDSRADRTIRQSLSLLFADRAAECAICAASIPSSRQYCYDCSAARQRYRDRQSRHRRAMAICEWPPCSEFFEGHISKKQRFCSRECADKGRFKTHCKRGHDKAVTGRDPSGDCTQCRRDRQRKAA